VSNGKLDGVPELCEQLLAAARIAGDLAEQADTLFLMAVAARMGGQFAAAAARLRESAELAVSSGYPLRMIDIIDQAGYLCAATGRPAEAITLWSARTAQCQAAGLVEPHHLSRRRDEAELFEHQQPVVHQVEGSVLTVAEAEHLDIGHRDRPPGGRDVAGRAVQDAPVGPGEGAFLDGDVAGHVQGVHLDVRIGEGAEPGREEPRAGRLALAAYPAGRMEDDIIGQHAAEPVDVVGVKRLRSLHERLVHGHRHL